MHRAGMDTRIEQCSLSHNSKRHTLRGMHYQVAPHEESKWVSCQVGEVFDVIVDVRPESSTYGQWFGVVLSATNHNTIFVPPGVAHGFLTLADETTVHYQIGGVFEPASARGVRWDDSAFAINWPATPAVISDRDANYPDFAL